MSRRHTGFGHFVVGCFLVAIAGASGCIGDPADFEAGNVEDTGVDEETGDQFPPDCEEGLKWCGDAFGAGGCVDTSADPAHCGRCDNPCITDTPGRIGYCDDGTCTSRCDEADGFVDCTGDGQCANLAGDDEHCGVCGNACTDGSCIDGQCTLTECDPDARPFGGGSGTMSDPFLLCHPEQLQRIGSESNYWSSSFELRDDLDLEHLADAPFEPIPQFHGVLDGNGHVVANFQGNYDRRLVGLIQRVGSSALIANLHLVSVAIDNAHFTDENDNVELTGSIAASNSGTIRNASLSGEITGVRYVGGMVGFNVGEITDCTAEASVHGSSIGAGGIAGANWGNIENARVEGVDTDNITGDAAVGGIAGANGSRIADSVTEARVQGTDWGIGGAVGSNTGTLFSVHAKSATEVGGSSAYVGGLVGFHGGRIEQASSLATVSAPEANEVGGLAGRLANEHYPEPHIVASYAAGTVDANWAVGGLVGSIAEQSQIEESYAAGTTSGNATVGGLAGIMWTGRIANTYAVGEVFSFDQPGGLLGEAYGGIDDQYRTIASSYWDVTTTGQPESAADGQPLDSNADGSNQFANPTNFAGWNFEDIWVIPEPDDVDADDFVRPRLRWEFEQ